MTRALSSFYGTRFSLSTSTTNRATNTRRCYGKSTIFMMPEGPEVRTVVNQLQPAVGMRLKNIHFLSGRYVTHDRPTGFHDFGKTITPLKTTNFSSSGATGEVEEVDVIKGWNVKGKFMWIRLDHGNNVHIDDDDDFCRSIWVTLGMSGRFLNESHPKVDQARWYLELADIATGRIRRVYYHDTRNFGTLRFSLSKKELEDKLQSLGTDLLTELKEDTFMEIIRNQKESTNICKFLMDQKKIAGIGNYLLAEGLYRAQIDPWASISELSDKQCRELYRHIKKTADDSYAAQGVTRPKGGSYTDVDGNTGQFQFQLQCYGREFCPKGREVVKDMNGPHGRTIWYVRDQLTVPLESRVIARDQENRLLDDDTNRKRTNGRMNNNNNNQDNLNLDQMAALAGFLVEPGWKSSLEEHIHSESFKNLQSFLSKEWGSNTNVFPPQKDIFASLNGCPLSSVKVVIVGQDPYHGKGQGHGLAFSVKKGVKIPPSLKNIHNELKTDIGLKTNPSHGCLQTWASQGVLLLNTVLTVREGKANSHAGEGWENFTDRIIEILNEEKENLVFLLWGKPAASKCKNIDENRHTIIASSHPSPLSASKTFAPFFGSKCFSRANEALVSRGLSPIDWSSIVEDEL